MANLKSAQLIETTYEQVGSEIISRTTITTIGEDREVKPQSPLWIIVNNGDLPILINNSYQIVGGDRFGIDLTSIIKPGLTHKNDSVFSVRFLEPSSNT